MSNSSDYLDGIQLRGINKFTKGSDSKHRKEDETTKKPSRNKDFVLADNNSSTGESSPAGFMGKGRKFTANIKETGAASLTNLGSLASLKKKYPANKEPAPVIPKRTLSIKNLDQGADIPGSSAGAAKVSQNMLIAAKLAERMESAELDDKTGSEASSNTDYSTKRGESTASRKTPDIGRQARAAQTVQRGDRSQGSSKALPNRMYQTTPRTHAHTESLPHDKTNDNSRAQINDLESLEALIDRKKIKTISNDRVRELTTSKGRHGLPRDNDLNETTSFHTYDGAGVSHMKTSKSTNPDCFDSLLMQLAELSDRTSNTSKGEIRESPRIKSPREHSELKKAKGSSKVKEPESPSHNVAEPIKNEKKPAEVKTSKATPPPPPPVEPSSAVNSVEVTSGSLDNESSDLESQREIMETDAKRREADSIKVNRKKADRMELEMIAAARLREQGSEITGNPASILEEEYPDDSLVVSDYLEALCSLLSKSQDSNPLPDDFYSIEGYSSWGSTIGTSLGEAMAKILKIRFPQNSKFKDRFALTQTSNIGKLPSNSTINSLIGRSPLVVVLSIYEARNLVCKEKKQRFSYCEIQSGNIPDEGTAEAKKYDKGNSKREVYRTMVAEGKDPTWNQNVTLQTSNIEDKIEITVLDKHKSHVSGKIKISFYDVLLAKYSGKRMEGWFPLRGGDKKDKSKYIGGDLNFGISIKSLPQGIISEETENDTARRGSFKSLNDMMSDLESLDVKFSSLLRVLIANCLELELMVPGQKKFNCIFSPETRSLLRIIVNLFKVSVIFVDYVYLDLIFERSTKNELHVLMVLSAYERLKEDLKKQPVKPSSDIGKNIIDLLNQIYENYRSGVINYKEAYPNNKPERTLETVVLLMRMIFKNPLYRAESKMKPSSFRDELRSMLAEAAIIRYQKLKELSDPLDINDSPSILNSLIKLTEMITNELDDDTNVYHSAFIKELDICRLTTEIYLKYYILALEQAADQISSDSAVENCSDKVFELHGLICDLDMKYAKNIPGLKRLSINMGFSPERWFAPFIFKWLNHSEGKMIDWTQRAIENDQFTPTGTSDDGIQYTASVVDLYTSIYTELKFIQDLRWGNNVQKAIFLQSFSKSVFKTIEKYCEYIMVGSKNKSTEEGANPSSSWQFFINVAQGRDSSKSAPEEINAVTCVKLCNVAYAEKKLRTLYNDMDAKNVTKVIKNCREFSPPNEKKQEGGTLRINLIEGENLKGCNKNGLSNPYIIICAPENSGSKVREESALSLFTKYFGTYSVRGIERHNSSRSNSSRDLNGENKNADSEAGMSGESNGTSRTFEISRSKAINDTVNPVWDESCNVSLSNFGKLKVTVMSANFLSSDVNIGEGTIDISENSRLRKMITDSELHNIYVDIEPQGRIHIGISLEGNLEDTDFWFGKCHECLQHLRVEIVRYLAEKISPYVSKIIVKGIKEQEAKSVQTKTFFSLKTSIQYLDVTNDDISINEPMKPNEVSKVLDQLLDYLDKNLSTLADNLPLKLAQEVIRRLWEEIESCIISSLVPQLYGTFDKDLRYLNPRQVSLCEGILREICLFFHAGGEGMGLPLRMLQNMNYQYLNDLFRIYNESLEKIMEECEKEIARGKTTGFTLRCARFKIESLEGDSKENYREWFKEQLSEKKRIEQQRK